MFSFLSKEQRLARKEEREYIKQQRDYQRYVKQQDKRRQTDINAMRQ